MPNTAIVAPLEQWMIPALIDMGAELMAASQYTTPFDEHYTRELADTALRTPHFKVWMAWDKIDERLQACGVIIGSVNRMLFSPALMAVEETVYVRPCRYRAVIADNLMQVLQHWAFIDNKAAFLRAGETSGIEPRAVDAFMRRNKLRRVGTLYQLENSQ